MVLHLGHSHPVVTVQAIVPDDRLDGIGIGGAGGIVRFLKSVCPSFIIIRTQVEKGSIAPVLNQEPRMVLIGIGYRIVGTELLICLVIVIDEVSSSFLQPGRCRLDPEMVVALSGKLTGTACTFNDALRQDD